jgi:cell division protein FtsZ
MPRIDELPIPAQNQIRARQAEAAATSEKPRPSLLQRLASVGLGRREGEAPTAQAPAPVAQRVTPPMPKAPPMPPLAQQTARPEGISDYAKRPVIQRPAPQGLDQHGRSAPVHNSVEEDQLEIPAFLRRQAN